MPRKLAPVVKLADTYASGAYDRKVVEVQILSGAQRTKWVGTREDLNGKGVGKTGVFPWRKYQNLSIKYIQVALRAIYLHREA